MMAKGKYAARAAVHKAELEVTNDLASYQHRVARLTAENRELRERLAAQDRVAKQTERRLRAERDEGVAPQVEALTLTLRSAVDARDKARKRAAECEDLWERAGRSLIDHFRKEHGCALNDALEAAGRLIGERWLLTGDVAKASLPDETGIVRIQRARGTRRTLAGE